VVVAIAAACNAYRTNTGLIAAIVMGVALANIEGFEHAEHRRFFRTVVQLVIGLLFISISATVTPTSVSRVLWPTLAVVLCLVPRSARTCRRANAHSSDGWIPVASWPRRQQRPSVVPLPG
jgi:NhaP-type Na+/H+ or K+/H+ antiporter